MRNFDESLERLAQNGTEWKFGAITKDLAAVPLKDRIDYLPYGVLQYNNIMDSNGCASRAPLNAIETKLNWFYQNGMHPAIKEWCDKNGYRIDGKFKLCDAFIEILSGTTITGNSLKAPVDAIRKYGVIPAALIPLQDGMTWEQYMNPKRITEAHMKLGKEFLRRIQIQYEQFATSNLEALNEDIADVAGHAWPYPVNGVYPRNDGVFNHAFITLNTQIDAFDNYQPFVKRLAKDYRFFEWGYSISFTNQNPFPDETMALFDVLKERGLLAFFAEAYRRLVEVKVTPVTLPKKDYITAFALAIQKMEGWYVGSRSYRNNNPGNCKFVKQSGAVGFDKDGFAVFPDYSTGFNYLKILLVNACSGKSQVYSPEDDLYDFFGKYAPANDGNEPVQYAKEVASALGVSPETKLKDLL